jgi:hypothetical protein
LALATRAGNADVQAQWTLFLPALVAARADGISAVEIRASREAIAAMRDGNMVSL